MSVFRIVKESRAKARDHPVMDTMRVPLQNQSLFAWCSRYLWSSPSVERAEAAMTQARQMMKINAGDKSLAAIGCVVRLFIPDEKKELYEDCNDSWHLLHVAIDTGNDNVWDILSEMWDNPGGYIE